MTVSRRVYVGICTAYMHYCIFLYASVNFFLFDHANYLLHTAPRARMFFLPCYPSNEWGSSPVGQSEISMTGRHSHGRWVSLLYMAFARQMRWIGDVSIIITLDWEKHIRVVKLCMTFESGPEWIQTVSWALYDLLLIQCWCRTGSRPARPLLPPPHLTHSGRTATWRRRQVALWAKIIKI